MRRASGSLVGREIQERGYRFGRDVMHYACACESLSAIGRELLRQLFRSATSIGANLQEAQAAVSRRDFVHKTGLARKEAFETRYWLRLRRDMCPDDPELPSLQQEADELCRILTAILISARRHGQERNDTS
ncbi:MAG: four helix bundle protein [Acidobacteria bacterium]|nr:four helix bundle protein [Acidobacteriota bacterium]